MAQNVQPSQRGLRKPVLVTPFHNFPAQHRVAAIV